VSSKRVERVGCSSLIRARLASPYRVLLSESNMYHLLIKQVSTVISGFLQQRALAWVGFYRRVSGGLSDELVYLQPTYIYFSQY